MKRRTVTMRRTVTLAALGLLFFVAGCIVQIRPDGGMRIDLPPFGSPPSPVAGGPVTAAMPFTVTAVVVDRSVLTGTGTPTGTIPTTATATLIATAPTTVPTNTATLIATAPTAVPTVTATLIATAPTAVPTTTATMTTTATVTATATVTGTPPMTPTGTVTTTGTPTPMPGTPVTGTPPTGTVTRLPTTLTPPPGTRTAVPTIATLSPTATTTRAATLTPTRAATATAPSTPTATAPISPTSATPPATPTPIPGTVFLGSHQGYEVDSTFYVVGEVLNGESFPVFNVKVIGSFYDANGNLVGAQESVTNLIQIEPELDSPFKLAIPSSGNISRYELTLVWDDVSIIDYEELTVLSQEIRGEGQREIFGELLNDGSVDVRDIVVVVTFYDESGVVVDTYQGTTSEPSVAPNGTVGYTIPITNPDLKYARFTVQAQGSLMLF